MSLTRIQAFGLVREIFKMEVSFVGVAGTVVGKGLPRAVTDVRYSRRRLCSTSATLGDDSVSDRAKEALQIQTEYGAIEKADLAEEMSKSYMAYAMSVILGRALPDIRDGLKPVHRRILYAMHQMKVGADSPYRKSARVVGEVLGKYHPHGEGSVYDALVRMAQTFSSSIPLIDGHGNFGSIDGDSPAAMRYTECRLSKLSTQALLRDIEYGTVDFTPNFDSMEQEPNVIPSRIPNLLISGSQGIAVGVATKIPPFNLVETLEALGCLLDNPDCSSEELAEILPAPDFPTGGQIVGLSGARDLFMTGKGKIMMRAKTHFELVKLKGGRTREAIIVTEIPYQLNKSTIVKSIAELVNSKQLEGVADLRDESDRSGTRIVVEVAKSAHSEVVRNNLLKKSALQTSFSGQIVALDGGKLPKLYNVRECLEKFIEFRKQIILKRAKFEMDKAAARDHTVQGYLKVLRDVDNAIRIIRNSEEAKEAKAQLMSPAGSFGLSAEQADAVLNLPLRRITKMETSSLTVEHEKLEATIADLRETLVNDEKVCKIMKAEFAEVLKSAGKKAERRTEIVSGSPEYEDELKLIPNGRSVIVITEKGYMKRMPISNFNVQHRGGTGSSGIGNLREDDGVSHFFTCRDHDTVIVITKIGIVYRLPAYKIPVSPRSSRGTLISKLFPHMTSKVAEVLIVHESEEDEYLVIVTKRGRMKKITLSILAKVSRFDSLHKRMNSNRGRGDLIPFVRCIS
uniref:DNA topoisomerase (ATP-hydrolyzing) n=1 Tax=Rhodosorus marinus TaxID=101924 RepID=A0A7S2ZEF2_9RHOD|mmetsp:Transcript_1667/g.6216  ORF Transcript_1667/g.6216 Transcript_1667/m.6216 type:complete len:740 (+) Transcript_1667:189-2408(+)